MQEDLLASEPVPPVSEVPIEDVLERVQMMVGRVVVAKSMSRPHTLVQRLLEEDERRRKEKRASKYDWLLNDPLFEGRMQRRRLRLINAVFLGLMRCGMKPSVDDKETNAFSVRVDDQPVPFCVVVTNRRSARRGSPTGRQEPSQGLRLEIPLCYGSKDVRSSWEDDGAARLEDHVTEVVVQLIVSGEVQYRESEQRRYQWIVERKAELEERARQEREERARRERERILRLQQ